MKKTFIIIAALTLVAVFSMPALAVDNAQDFVTFGQVSGETCSYGLSNNVVMSYTSTSGQGYGLASKHKSGNREYYTGSAMSQIFYIENDDFKGVDTISQSVADDQATAFSSGGAKAL